MAKYNLLGGAFSAELIKGKWEYTPNLSKIGKKEYKGSEKETPQFAVVNDIEKASSEHNKTILNQTVLDITKFLLNHG